jgi:hypothetical protein
LPAGRDYLSAGTPAHGDPTRDVIGFVIGCVLQTAFVTDTPGEWLLRSKIGTDNQAVFNVHDFLPYARVTAPAVNESTGRD